MALEICFSRSAASAAGPRRVRVGQHGRAVSLGLAEPTGGDRGQHHLAADLGLVLGRTPVPGAEGERSIVETGLAKHQQAFEQRLTGRVAVAGGRQPADGAVEVVGDRQPGQLDEREPGPRAVRQLLGERPHGVVGAARPRLRGVGRRCTRPVALGRLPADDLGQLGERDRVVGVGGELLAQRALGATLGLPHARAGAFGQYGARAGSRSETRRRSRSRNDMEPFPATATVVPDMGPSQGMRAAVATTTVTHRYARRLPRIGWLHLAELSPMVGPGRSRRGHGGVTAIVVSRQLRSGA